MQPGDRVERYLLKRRLGEGASGEVWLGTHEGLGTEHALKLLKHDVALVRKRALSEGRAQAKLRHPNVVAVSDVLEIDRQLVLVQEYVEGPALDAVIADFALSQAQIDAVAIGMLAGLGCAHDAGLVHRDVKPANLLLAVTREGVIPKIADFGLVRDLGAMGSQTRTEATLGTPAYMAPEQFRDARKVDARSDVYSAGAMLYELVSGMLPYHEEGLIQLYEAAMEGRYRPLDSLVPSAPQRWIRAIHASLSPDPDQRPQSTVAMLALWVDGMPRWPEPVWEEPVRRRLLELVGPGTGGTGTVSEPIEPAVRPKALRLPKTKKTGASRSRLGLGIGVLALSGIGGGAAVLLLGLGAWWWGSDVEPDAPPVEILGDRAEEPEPAPEPESQPDPVPEPDPVPVPVPVARPVTVPVPVPVARPVTAPVPVVAPAPTPQRATVTVTGDVRVMLGQPGGGLVPVGDVAPGIYAVWAYFEPEHPTRALEIALEVGQKRTVKCNLELRTCR